MFMILSRSSKNRLGLSGFVKKSARLASLRRGGGGAARGEQGLGLAPDPFPDGRFEGADELEEQLV